MYSRMETGKRGRDEEEGGSSYEEGDEEAAVARLIAHADEEASTSGAGVGDDRDASVDEAEGIPLIQIRSYDDRVKDGGDSGSLSPDQPQCRICLDSGGTMLLHHPPHFLK
jgi:hypothetical protein